MKESGLMSSVHDNNLSEDAINKGIIGQIQLDKDYCTVNELPNDLMPMPMAIIQQLRDASGTRNILERMGYILPRKDKCPLDFMLAILSGSKLGISPFKFIIISIESSEIFFNA